MSKYRCSICGYVHECEGDLPADYVNNRQINLRR